MREKERRDNATIYFFHNCTSKYETLYHEDHGATLKHKCGKG